MRHTAGPRARPWVRPRRPAAPRVLDPILVLWERVDRRRRHIRPARPGALIGVEPARHRGPTVRLADGAVVREGDRILELHLDNRGVLEATRGGGALPIDRGRRDLAAIERWVRRQPPADRPVALHGRTLLWPLAARTGFEIHPCRRTARIRLDEWFLRWLMGRWSAQGRSRLRAGRSRLRSADCWRSISTAEER